MNFAGVNRFRFIQLLLALNLLLGSNVQAELSGYGTDSQFGSNGNICNARNSTEVFSCYQTHQDGSPTEIVLTSDTPYEFSNDLNVRKSHLTIRPADNLSRQVVWIMQTGAQLALLVGDGAHDILIRGFKIQSSNYWDGQSVGGSFSDAILYIAGENGGLSNCTDANIVLDRMTIAGSKDAAGDIDSTVCGITFQYSLWLDNYHPLSWTDQSPGTDVRRRLSFHHNIVYNYAERGLQWRGLTSGEVINNVFAGWGDSQFTNNFGYGFRFHHRDGNAPRETNLLGNVFLDWNPPGTFTTASGDRALVFSVPTDACYGMQNYFPESESDRCTAVEMFPRENSTLQPDFVPPSNLANTLFPTESSSIVGAYFPDQAVEEVLLAIRSRLLAELGGIVVPKPPVLLP